ncbi:MAG: glycolate oxidase FAD binding subunit [Halieaceae bacterium]|jgi:glycolate oxidase FAD binding subunit
MDCVQELGAAVRAAVSEKRQLTLCGGGSKALDGGGVAAEKLDLTCHSGVVSYEPSELVVTVRCGTSLAELDGLLAENGQMLACESPSLRGVATVGGTVACGLSGPRRPYAGSLRDFVLGVNMINGLGELLRFGGQVMKNVAGYDLSRLQVGAYGQLGAVLEVSLKVVPKPQRELTRYYEFAALEEAVRYTSGLIAQSVPLSGSCYHGNRLSLRFSGSTKTLDKLESSLGGEPGDDSHWLQLNNRELDFFQSSRWPLWRVSLPEGVQELPFPGDCLYEWGGCLRWFSGEADGEALRRWCTERGGYATLHRNARTPEHGYALPNPALQGWHDRLRDAFDPQRVFNPGISNFGSTSPVIS